MKAFHLFLVLMLFNFVSCSSTDKDRTVQLEKDEKDIFENETFQRKSKAYVGKKFKTAAGYCYKGETKKGLKILKKSFGKYGKSSPYWNSIGNCYLLKRDYNKANFYYKIGLSYNNDDAQILNNIAYIHINKKQYYKAYEILKKVNQKTDLLVAKYNLASLHFYFSKYDKSINLLKELYRLNAKDPDLNLLLAKNYLYRGDYLTAQSYFEKLPEKFLEENEVSNYKSYNLIKLGSFEKAKEVLYTQRSVSSEESMNFKNNISLLLNEKLEEEKKESEAQ